MASLQEIKGKLITLKDSVAGVKTQVTTVDTNLDKVRGLVAALQAGQAPAEQDLLELNQAVDEVATALTELGSALGSVSTEVDGITSAPVTP